MKYTKTENIILIVLGVTLILFGIDIVVTGKIRAVILGDERYVVGGLTIFVGMYILKMLYKINKK